MEKSILLATNYRLHFANDIILLAENPKNLIDMLQQLEDESAKADLYMYTSKTKVVTNSLTKKNHGQ